MGKVERVTPLTKEEIQKIKRLVGNGFPPITLGTLAMEFNTTPGVLKRRAFYSGIILHSRLCADEVREVVAK